MRKKYPDFPYTELQLKWLKTLEGKDRNFKPQQAIGYLRDADCNGYCCLGVASKIAIDDGLIVGKWIEMYDEEDPCYTDPIGPYRLLVDGSDEECDEILPEPMWKLLHLRNQAGESAKLDNTTDYPNGYSDFDYKHNREPAFEPDGLADLNDGGCTFKEIAKIIRMFPHFYFTNGGEPLESVYRTCVFHSGYSPHEEA